MIYKICKRKSPTLQKNVGDLFTWGNQHETPSEMGRVGFEPTTNALKGHCSTTELPTHDIKREVCVESRMATSKPEPNFPPA